MRPADHPDFFRLPPPEGASRESSIVVDAEGRFWHEDRLVEHPGMARAFASWIDRHPDDGRYILNNGYDWTYVRVVDAPFAVVAVHGSGGGGPSGGALEGAEGGDVELELTDGTREPLDPARLTVEADGVLSSAVKGGRFRARFQRQAQLALGPYLVEGENGRPLLLIGGKPWPLPTRAAGAGREA